MTNFFVKLAVKHKRRMKYAGIAFIVVLLTCRLLLKSMVPTHRDTPVSAFDHFCLPFGSADLRDFVWSHQAAVNNKLATETLLESGVGRYYVDVSYENNKDFLVHSTTTEPLTDFVQRLAEEIPAMAFQSSGDLPVLIVRPTFDDAVGLLAMLAQLYQSNLAEKIAVLCSNSGLANAVAEFSPQYIAYAFDQANDENFYEEAQQICPEATAVLMATVTPPTQQGAIQFSSPGLSGSKPPRNWKEDFPDSTVVVRFVDTWEQLLWALDQGVDGIVSNNALDIHGAVLDWYRASCSIKSMLQIKLMGGL